MKDCIGRMIQHGRLTPTTADELVNEVNKIINQRGLDGDNLTTRTEIEHEVLKSAIGSANTRVLAAAQEIKIFNELSARVKAHSISQDAGIAEILDIAYDGTSPLLASLMAPVSKMNVHFRSKYPGLFGGKFSKKGRAEIDQLGRAMFGETENVPSFIKEFMENIQKVDDRTIKLSRAAGIDVAQRKQLHPQIWDKNAIVRNFKSSKDYADKVVNEHGYTSDSLVTGLKNPQELTHAIARDAYDSMISGEHAVKHQSQWFRDNPDFNKGTVRDLDLDPDFDAEDIAKAIKEAETAKKIPQGLSKAEAEKLIRESIDDEGRKIIKAGNKKLGNKLNDRLLSKSRKSRTLHAPNYESWKAVNKLAGQGDILDQWYTHMSKKAHEINLASTLGVNYNRVFKKLQAEANLARSTSPVKTKIDTSKGYEKFKAKAQDVFINKNGMAVSNETRFKNLTMENEVIGHEGFADWAQAIRNYISAGLLGGSSIVSVTDRAFLKQLSRTMGTKYRNIERDVFRSMKDTLTGKDLEEALLHYAASIEYVMQQGGAASRYVDTGAIGKMSKGANRAFDITLGANGLNLMNRTGKIAAALDVQRGIAKAHKGIKSFDELSPEFKNIYKEFRIGPKEFNDIHNAIKKIKIEGKDWTYDVVDTQKITDPLSLAKYNGMLGRLVREGIPEPGLEAKSIMRERATPGTPMGEAAKTFWTLQSFPMTMLMNSLRLFTSASERFANTKHGRMKALAHVTAETTLLGVIAIQAREMSKGREPLPWDSPELMASAFLLGSPAGFLTDVLPKAVQGGRDFKRGFGGPIVDTFADVLDIVSDTATGKFGKAGAKATKLGEKVLPGPFYLDMFTSMISDRLRMLMDPKGTRASNKARERYQRERRENSLLGNGK